MSAIRACNQPCPLQQQEKTKLLLRRSSWSTSRTEMAKSFLASLKPAKPPAGSSASPRMRYTNCSKKCSTCPNDIQPLQIHS